MAIFYGLPKIHKTFTDFPPLRPIVSGFNSCTSRLSEYLDTFLKYQAKKGKSYLRDTKEFLCKLRCIKSLPENAILVTMDVVSLYKNIDHTEGAEACYNKLESRTDKKISSSLLRKLILLVLQSNVFRFNHQLYQQIKGTAMGTPMAVNYANIFLDDFETKMLDEYEKKTKIRPLIWWRYIDDIFFIWHDDEKSLKDFINFCDEYSQSKKMKSKIRFDSNISRESTNFLDVKVRICGKNITTSVYSKPTDAHLYLNRKSCHPTHVIQNLPKGQFIRVRRICSQISDFDDYSKTMKKHFVSRGYDEKVLSKTIQNVRKMERADLLKDKVQKEKDESKILVCTWHPSLRKASSTLHQNHSILSTDFQLKKIFEEKQMVAFRRRKNIGNFLCRNDVRENETTGAAACKGCKLCRILSPDEVITNKNNGAQVKIKPGATCKTTGLIYAVTCKKCQQIYVGHTVESMATRWSKNKWDIINRPNQNELATHCHHNHDLEKDLEVTILDHGFPLLSERERMEDRYICRLQTLQSNGGGMNIETHAYAKEMYQLWERVVSQDKN